MKITKIKDVNMTGMSFNFEDIIDGTIFKNELLLNYGCWSFLHNDEVTPKDALQGLYNQFINVYGNDIERIYDALQEDYEVLDNYNGSTITTIGTKTTTNVYGEQKSIFGHGATSTTMGGGTDTIENKKANSESTLTSDSYLNDEKTEQTNASRTNSTIAYDDDNTINEHTDTSTDSGNTVTEVKHGNLGVTTSQQMLTSEIELRKKTNFYRILIEDMFLHNYLFIFD